MNATSMSQPGDGMLSGAQAPTANQRATTRPTNTTAAATSPGRSRISRLRPNTVMQAQAAPIG
jgi:hypothetical protein